MGGSHNDKMFICVFVCSIIYPQNRKGEPEYNPCGKYMVKLHINGVPRKVPNHSKIHLLKKNSIMSFSLFEDERVQDTCHSLGVCFSVRWLLTTSSRWIAMASCFAPTPVIAMNFGCRSLRRPTWRSWEDTIFQAPILWVTSDFDASLNKTFLSPKLMYLFHHPSECWTLVVVEERPHMIVKRFWVYSNTHSAI